MTLCMTRGSVEGAHGLYGTGGAPVSGARWNSSQLIVFFPVQEELAGLDVSYHAGWEFPPYLMPLVENLRSLTQVQEKLAEQATHVGSYAEVRPQLAHSASPLGRATAANDEINDGNPDLNNHDAALETLIDCEALYSDFCICS
jgi:hypothetical protein